MSLWRIVMNMQQLKFPEARKSLLHSYHKGPGISYLAHTIPEPSLTLVNRSLASGLTSDPLNGNFSGFLARSSVTELFSARAHRKLIFKRYCALQHVVLVEEINKL